MVFKRKIKSLILALFALALCGMISACVVDAKDDEKSEQTPTEEVAELSSVKIDGAAGIEATKSGTLTATPTFTNASGDSSSVTYKWEITGGSGYATLSPTSGTSVTITGKNTTTSEQTVTVKVTATYNNKSVSATYNVKIAAGGESGGESGGSGSGGTSGNVISKNGTPTGFATIDVSKMTKTITVSTAADFKTYVEKGGYIVYVSGSIDLSKGKLPSEAGGTSTALDEFVKSKSSGAYTSYKTFIDAYTKSCESSTNHKDNPKTSTWAACTVDDDTTTTLMNQMWYLNTAYGNEITIKPKSNTMIIGLDENAEIYGGSFNISSVSNVAIRNVTIRDAYDPFPHHEKNDGFNAQHDCIVIQGTSSNIWIDHCTLKDSYHCVNAANGEKFQTYDGLLDMKNNTYNLTVSYCKFQDHDKTMLIGSSKDDGSNETRTITLHHNYFLNCGQRLPMVRNTRLHNFNNYYDTDSNRYWAQQYAVGVRENALIVSENNYFGTGVKYSYKDSDGTLYHSGDVDNSSGKITTTTVTSTKPFTPTYSYTPDAAADLPTLIPENAGAGVWSVVQ